MHWALKHRVSLVPSGGRTGLSDGAVAANSEVVVSPERMNRILSFDVVHRTLDVEAGVATEAVQNAAQEQGLITLLTSLAADHHTSAAT